MILSIHARENCYLHPQWMFIIDLWKLHDIVIKTVLIGQSLVSFSRSTWGGHAA